MATPTMGRIAPEGLRHPDRSKVVVTAGITAHAVQVHHRELPELQAHGETPRSAAVNLEQDFAREIEGIIEEDRREPFLRALDDIREFITPSH